MRSPGHTTGVFCVGLLDGTGLLDAGGADRPFGLPSSVVPVSTWPPEIVCQVHASIDGMASRHDGGVC
jgi:hypothetical protein